MNFILKEHYGKIDARIASNHSMPTKERLGLYFRLVTICSVAEDHIILETFYAGRNKTPFLHNVHGQNGPDMSLGKGPVT